MAALPLKAQVGNSSMRPWDRPGKRLQRGASTAGALLPAPAASCASATGRRGAVITQGTASASKHVWRAAGR
jgi:hypothetical protein